MPRPKNIVPSLRLHRASGQAVVTIEGKTLYLGRYGSPESRERYRALVSEYASTGRLPTDPKDGITVTQALVIYWRHACDTYANRPDARRRIRRALRVVKRVKGEIPAAEFGPRALHEVRSEMVKAGWSRGTVNERVRWVKSCFRWLCEMQHLSPTVWYGLSAVRGLRFGETTAREPMRRHPVPIEDVEATMPYLNAQVAAIVRLLMLTGARPSEICKLKGSDIDVTGPLWVCNLKEHKTAGKGKDRVLVFGPRAQEVIRPFLGMNVGTYLFRPIDADVEWKRRKRANRKTKVQPSQQHRKRKADPRRQPGEHYVAETLRRHITRAIERANEATARTDDDGGLEVETVRRVIPNWTPYQCRHLAATEVRKQFGVEAAAHLLGHAKVETTEVYAERSLEVVKRVMERVG